MSVGYNIDPAASQVPKLGPIVSSFTTVAQCLACPQESCPQLTDHDICHGDGLSPFSRPCPSDSGCNGHANHPADLCVDLTTYPITGCPPVTSSK